MKFFSFLFFLLILSLGMFAIIKGLRIQEVTECKQWQLDNIKYPNWYATDWQIKQCESVGFPIYQK